MFEKSLYDLIRGLRQNKGNEKAYIQNCLKECRQEVRSTDGDLKATAILKLIYLDMFGYDMSWASFNVLEVMSSGKFQHKRIGYLAAVQSFRLDTEVLMLTTNQIKKDLSSPSIYDISTAINGLSHIVSPSLARDLSTDLISKMNHSNPYIRKKAILVMYKCFLQSPELLRTSWPKLKECLNDEDNSVVSATVNIICELARKNPRNYLPLAPQLFKLLTTSSNNWMTIKIIKLFATLTPLEPRLVKKLIPPITDLIRTTPAMSVLYECINGLIAGGLLAAMANTQEGEELATVCVDKLRGFLVEGDANLKYVGLLAFTKLVKTHAHLVANHQDVILECIDDPDISIRLRALDLAVGMVTSDNLLMVVSKLMKQLRPLSASAAGSPGDGTPAEEDYEDMEDMEEELHPNESRAPPPAPVILPEGYKVGVIKRILEMCSHDMYANIVDFEWYLDVLAQLIRHAPPVGLKSQEDEEEEDYGDEESEDVGEEIGKEIRNVAVRVKSVRGEAANLAALLVERKEGMFPAAGGGGRRVLGYAGWIVGEYAELLENPQEVIYALIHSHTHTLPHDIQAVYIQAIPKVYAALTSNENVRWNSERKSIITMLTSRVLEFLVPASSSPSLEVQERAVEFVELFKLSSEAISEHPASDEAEPPLLLTQLIPSLFSGQELNPVAPRAQRKVPLPPNLDLDTPINPNLSSLLTTTDLDTSLTPEEQEDHDSYYKRPKSKPAPVTAIENVPASARLPTASSTGPGTTSYQSSPSYLDADIAKRRAERQNRNRDDPFYIPTGNEAEGDVDIDSIPIMKLDLSGVDLKKVHKTNKASRKKVNRAEIVRDENLEGEEMVVEEEEKDKKRRNKKGGLGLLSVGRGLEGVDLTKDPEVEADEIKAREEVERLRREIEGRREVQGKEEVQEEKPKVKKKKKKVKEGEEEGEKKKKKKKKKKVEGEDKVAEKTKE